MAILTNDPILTTWKRHFRRTNVYVAEYIIMLVLMGALAGLLCSLTFSFFNLLMAESFTTSILGLATVAQLGALAAVTPAAVWFYLRVTGQEMIEPALHTKTVRTVFLTIWLIGMFVSVVGVNASVVSGIIGAFVSGVSLNIGQLLVGLILPGLLSVAILMFTTVVVMRRSTRSLSKIAAIVFSSLALVVLIAGFATTVIKLNSSSNNNSNNDRCTYSMYRDDECSYSDYREYYNSERSYDTYDSSRSGAGGFENIYQPSSRY